MVASFLRTVSLTRRKSSVRNYPEGFFCAQRPRRKSLYLLGIHDKLARSALGKLTSDAVIYPDYRRNMGSERRGADAETGADEKIIYPDY